MPFPIGAALGGGLGFLGGLFGGGNRLDPEQQRILNQARGVAGGYAGDNSLMDAYRSVLPGMGFGTNILMGQDPEALKRMIAPMLAQLSPLWQNQHDQGLTDLQKSQTLMGGIHNDRAPVGVGNFNSQMGLVQNQGMLGLLSQAMQNAQGLVSNGMQAGQGMDSHMQTILSMLLQSMGPQAAAKGNPFTGALGGALSGSALFPASKPADNTSGPATPPTPVPNPSRTVPGTTSWAPGQPLPPQWYGYGLLSGGR
jgi:hypothetical protein